jgi:hypothetical protein
MNRAHLATSSAGSRESQTVSGFTQYHKGVQMVRASMHIVTFALTLCWAVSSAQAQEPAPRAAPLALSSAVADMAAEVLSVSFGQTLAGLRRRLRLHTRFDWIRTYSPLGAHMYLVRSAAQEGGRRQVGTETRNVAS